MLLPKALIEAKAAGRKLAMLTAYDAVTGHLLVAGGIDLILVGDSLANTVLGYADTKGLSMDEMLHHIRAVSRGVGDPDKHIIGDMPIGSYQTSDKAVKNAKRFLEAGCHSVKIEGYCPEIFKAFKKNNILTVGHLGLLPQSAEKYEVQGKKPSEADKLLQTSVQLESLGVFLLVLECIPAELGKKITESLGIPTIGIGAGPACDGQVLVLNDMLGHASKIKPKFVRQYAQLHREALNAVRNYKKDVESGNYPSQDESY